MKFRAYLEALRLGLSELTNYRADMWFQVLSKLINLVGLGVLWYWLLQGNSENEIKSTIGYLLVANGVREVVDAFHLKYGGRLMEEIKDGTISSSLIRPINPYRISYFVFFGTRGSNFIFGLVLIVAGIIVFPPTTRINYLLFGAVVVLASIISYQLNIMAGFMAFWFTEASSMRGLFVHIARVLSGAMIPLNYFPDIFKNIALLSPFPVLAYLPAKIIQVGFKGYETTLGVSIIWIVFFWFLEKKLWIKGLKKYEAVGI